MRKLVDPSQIQAPLNPNMTGNRRGNYQTQPRKGTLLISVIQHLVRRPNLLVAGGIGILTLLGLLAICDLPTAALAGWCLGGLVYLTLVFAFMQKTTATTIRDRARLLDQGRFGILAALSAASIASLGAILVELANARTAPDQGARVALAATTLVISWLFIHVVFAEHYAHEHELNGGLGLPGESPPGYSDFLYFAFTIGMTFQVSDATTTTSAMRRAVLAHGLISFLFNTTILAIAINLAAALLG